MVALAAAPVHQPPSFKSQVQLVVVPATVTDLGGRAVTGLTSGNFKVFEDDAERPIAHVVSERTPISLGIVLDISQSMRGERFDDTRRALQLLLGQMTADDDVFLMIFSGVPKLLVPWTRNGQAVLRALDAVTPHGNTALFTAIREALPIMNQGRARRKALLVVSDGNDREGPEPWIPPQGLAGGGNRSNSLQERMAFESLRRFAFVRGEIRKSEAIVYALGIGSSNAVKGQSAYDPIDIAKLGELTDPTGGYSEAVLSSADILGAVSRVSDDLRHLYLIGFEPRRPADGKFHRLRVEATSRDHRVRAKTVYFAAQKPRH
jgi:Ca-activated chloride channel family protein